MNCGSKRDAEFQINSELKEVELENPMELKEIHAHYLGIERWIEMDELLSFINHKCFPQTLNRFILTFILFRMIYIKLFITAK